MSELVRQTNQGKPLGTALEVVEVDPAKALAIPPDELFERTAEAFERVRNYVPFGRDWADNLDRIIHRLCRRERRPIRVLQERKFLWDYTETLVSPAASLTDGSGTFCATALGELVGSFGPDNTPYVGMLATDTRQAITLNRARLSVTDVDVGQEPVNRFLLESAGVITRNTRLLSPEQRLGMGAVCLALERSY